LSDAVCRVGCGACCIAPSISSPIPGMPHGKPAGVRCVQLTADNRCSIFGQPGRPAVCGRLRAEPSMCGTDRESAMRWLAQLESVTAAAPEKLATEQ
jgi:uncharacterized protein